MTLMLTSSLCLFFCMVWPPFTFYCKLFFRSSGINQSSLGSHADSIGPQSRGNDDRLREGRHTTGVCVFGRQGILPEDRGAGGRLQDCELPAPHLQSGGRVRRGERGWLGDGGEVKFKAIFPSLFN